MSTFIPDEIAPPVREIPYYEESRAHDVPGRGTEKSITRLQSEVIDALTRLGSSRRCRRCTDRRCRRLSSAISG